MTDYDLGLIGIMAILLGLILTGMGIGLLIPDLARRIRNWLRRSGQASPRNRKAEK